MERSLSFTLHSNLDSKSRDKQLEIGNEAWQERYEVAWIYFDDVNLSWSLDAISS